MWMIVGERGIFFLPHESGGRKETSDTSHYHCPLFISVCVCQVPSLSINFISPSKSFLLSALVSSHLEREMMPSWFWKAVNIRRLLFSCFFRFCINDKFFFCFRIVVLSKQNPLPFLYCTPLIVEKSVTVYTINMYTIAVIMDHGIDCV